MAINGLGLSTNNISAQLASKLDIAGGKVLQIVRATDATDRTTTSTSYVDVTGMSVTITPQKNTSAVLILAFFGASISASNVSGYLRITDNSNNAISGAENLIHYTFSGGESWQIAVMAAYATPATTSATTYKMRFRVDGAATLNVRNANSTGQLYAIEVSA